MKRVYLIRHGKAEEFDSERHRGDADRALTAEGMEEFARVARQLRRLDEKIEIVLTSPLRRAVETAEILAKTLGTKTEVFGELTPPMSPPRLLNRLRARAETRVALVGHEPGLGQTVGRWISGVAVDVPLKKGGIARIDVPDGDGAEACELVWLATPDVMGAK